MYILKATATAGQFVLKIEAKSLAKLYILAKKKGLN